MSFPIEFWAILIYLQKLFIYEGNMPFANNDNYFLLSNFVPHFFFLAQSCWRVPLKQYLKLSSIIIFLTLMGMLQIVS